MNFILIKLAQNDNILGRTKQIGSHNSTERRPLKYINRRCVRQYCSSQHGFFYHNDFRSFKFKLIKSVRPIDILIHVKIKVRKL